MKRVRDPAALVMHNVIVTADGRPNEAFAWKRWIDDSVSRVPFLTGSASLPPQTVTIAGGKSLVE